MNKRKFFKNCLFGAIGGMTLGFSKIPLKEKAEMLTQKHFPNLSELNENTKVGDVISPVMHCSEYKCFTVQEQIYYFGVLPNTDNKEVRVAYYEIVHQRDSDCPTSMLYKSFNFDGNDKVYFNIKYKTISLI